MPYRPTNDGGVVKVRAENRPRKAGCARGTGCGPDRRGVGADEPGMQVRSGPMENQKTVAAAPEAGPPLSRGDAVALASGARIGDRAARYAIQVVKGRGLAAYGDADLDDADAQLASEQAYTDQWYRSRYPTDDQPVMTSDDWYAQQGMVPPWQQQQVTTNRVYASAPSQPADSGPSFLEMLFGRPKDGQGYASNLAQQAGGAYQQFTGRGPSTPQPKPQSSGPSTGTILAVLGAVAAIGIGVAVAVSMSNRSATRMANRRRARASYRARPRKTRYFVQRRAA